MERKLEEADLWYRICLEEASVSEGVDKRKWSEEARDWHKAYTEAKRLQMYDIVEEQEANTRREAEWAARLKAARTAMDARTGADGEIRKREPD